MSRKTTVFLLGVTVFIAALTGCNEKGKRDSMEGKQMTVQKEYFGKTPTGEKVDLYTLTNRRGMTVKITNYGGIVTSILVPDKEGNVADVVLGFNTLEEYLKGHPYFGALIGRYANRIAGASFTVEGKEYKLAANNGGNHLHGGLVGFDKRVWPAEEIRQDNEVGVKLSYFSKDMEEGYPGNLQVTVAYTLTDSNELKITYEAEVDKPCPVNLTHHGYFNLKGEGSGDILDHLLTIEAGRFTPVDDELIPTGEIKSVKGTPMDFTSPTAIGARIEAVKGGYDHNYVLNNRDGARQPAASAHEPTSGRLLEVFTSEPGLQFYSGNFLDGTLRGKSARPYNKHHGFCLETQHFPDSPHHPNFPSVILKPGETYRSETIYKFSSR